MMLDFEAEAIMAAAGTPAAISYLFEERWTGSDGAAWNATRWPEIQTTGTGASAVDIQGNEGRVATGGSAYRYSRMMSNSGSLTDFEIAGTIRISGVGEQYYAVNFRHTNGWKGANPDRPQDGYTLSFEHLASGSFVLYESTAGVRAALQTVAKTWGTDVWNFRVQAIGSALKAKAWQGAEPGTWDIEQTDAAHSAGALSLSAVNGNSSTVRTAFFDDLTVAAAP